MNSKKKKKRPQTYVLKDFLPNITFLAYFRPWDPSHWIQNAFLINFGTGNLENHQLGARIMSTDWIPQNCIFWWSFCRKLSRMFSYRIPKVNCSTILSAHGATPWGNSMDLEHYVEKFPGNVPIELTSDAVILWEKFPGSFPHNWKKSGARHAFFLKRCGGIPSEGGLCPLYLS